MGVGACLRLAMNDQGERPAFGPLGVEGAGIICVGHPQSRSAKADEQWATLTIDKKPS
jgi:hypothetical protein